MLKRQNWDLIRITVRRFPVTQICGLQTLPFPTLISNGFLYVNPDSDIDGDGLTEAQEKKLGTKSLCIGQSWNLFRILSGTETSYIH
jgi:hypothetical protein